MNKYIALPQQKITSFEAHFTRMQNFISRYLHSSRSMVQDLVLSFVLFIFYLGLYIFERNLLEMIDILDDYVPTQVKNYEKMRNLYDKITGITKKTPDFILILQNSGIGWSKKLAKRLESCNRKLVVINQKIDKAMKTLDTKQKSEYLSLIPEQNVWENHPKAYTFQF